MDEQRLGELFRAAVSEAPPASFDCAQVVAASRRATARRRQALAGGTLLGVAVLTGGLIASGLVGADRSEENSAAAPALSEGEARDPRAVDTLGAPSGAEADSPPGDTGLVGCGPPDAVLVAELTAVLVDRGTAVPGPASGVPEPGIRQPCPDGSRAAAVPVVGGTLHVVLVPQAEQLAPGQLAIPDSRGYTLMLDDGRELAVISIPEAPGQPAPLADDVPELTRQLAGRLTGTR